MPAGRKKGRRGGRWRGRPLLASSFAVYWFFLKKYMHDFHMLGWWQSLVGHQVRAFTPVPIWESFTLVFVVSILAWTTVVLESDHWRKLEPNNIIGIFALSKSQTRILFKPQTSSFVICFKPHQSVDTFLSLSLASLVLGSTSLGFYTGSCSRYKSGTGVQVLSR